MSDPVRVTVWGENVHEREEEDVRARYPDGMHAAIAQGLAAQLGERVRVRTATLQEPEHGLTAAVLEQTDVLTW
jgi:trehalose utilization protein